MKYARLIPLTLLLALLILGACIPMTGAPQVPDENLLSTLAMQTVSAQQTQSLFQTLVAQLSATPEPTNTPLPTETQVPPTATLPPTATQVPPTPTMAPPTLTPIIPTITNTPIPCNWAQFVDDVTIDDGAEFNPGESFTKTWRLKNIGSCTWTPDYQVVFSNGQAMGGPSSQNLGVTVAPGQTVDISIRLTAPQQSGTQTGHWLLKANNGIVFGIGKQANTAFWVKITVRGNLPTQTGAQYDFVASYCLAEWRTNLGLLTCPTDGSDLTKGSITRTTSPVFEGGYKDNESALILVPAPGDSGVITGKYPAFKVQDWQDFNMVIGCADNSPKCDVTIQLNYIADGGPVQNFASWTQTSDGKFEQIALDLNSLAGKSVQFVLTVYNNGNSQDDRVIILSPIIR